MVRFLLRICFNGGSFYGKVPAQNLFIWWQFLWLGYCSESVFMVADSMVRFLLRICLCGGECYRKVAARKLLYGCGFSDKVT